METVPNPPTGPPQKTRCPGRFWPTVIVSLTPGTRGAPRPRGTHQSRAATPSRRRIRPFMNAAPTGRRSTRSPTWTASRWVLTSTPRRRSGSANPATPIR